MTIRTAVVLALACVVITAGGCGPSSSEAKVVELTAESKDLKESRLWARQDQNTAELAFFETQERLVVTEINLADAQTRLEVANGQLSLLRRQIATISLNLAKADRAAKAARKDATKAATAMDKTIKANKALKKLNKSLTKSANDGKKENDALRNRIIGLELKIRQLEKNLANTPVK